MKMTKMHVFLGICAAICGALLVAPFQAGAAAATISTWNVGSGQYQDNFLVVNDPSFSGGEIELGLRAVFRQSAQLPVVSGNTYDVYPGPQTAGVNGAPVTNLARNAWNFDYHIYYAGGVQNLDSLVMTITSPSGNTVTQPGGYDMLVANNDNVTGSTPWPGGDSQNPAFFIQDSQNPVFAPWFVPTFDMNVTGVYTFTLVATEGNFSITNTMNVNVVPTSGPVGVGAIAGLAFMRRRRR